MLVEDEDDFERKQSIPEGHFVKEISDSYFIKEKTLLSANGLESKNPDMVDLYVDTHYVDFMLTQVTAECMYQVAEIKRRGEENKDAIANLIETQERQFRWIQSKMLKT
jgi:hypothetical protein